MSGTDGMLYMKGKRSEDIVKIVAVIVVNSLVGLIAYLLSRIGIGGRITSFVLVFVLSFILFLSEKKENRIWILFVQIWQYSFMLDVMYRISRFEAAPFEILYVFDILCIVFLVTQVKHLRKKDPVLVFLLLFLAVGCISTVRNASNPIDFLNSTRLTIRCLGFYLFASNNKIELPKWLRFFVGISIFAFIIECFFRYNVDFRNGLFGYDATGAMFAFVLICLFSLYLSSLIHSKHANVVIKFFGLIALIEVALILREQKAEVIAFPLCCLLVLLVRRANNVSSIIKKCIATVCIFCFLMVSWKATTFLFPKFKTLEGTSFVSAIQSRLTGQQMNLIDNAFEYVKVAEIEDTFQVFLGRGAGSAIPPYNFRLMIRSGLELRDFPYIFKFSDLYAKYNNYFSFFMSAKNCMLIDVGYIGTAIFYLLIIINAYRAISLCRYGTNRYDIAIAFVGIWQIFELLYRTIVYNFLVQLLPIAVTFALFGMINYRYRIVKFGKRSDLPLGGML